MTMMIWNLLDDCNGNGNGEVAGTETEIQKEKRKSNVRNSQMGKVNVQAEAEGKRNSTT
jgi:hypothetical protein